MSRYFFHTNNPRISLTKWISRICKPPSAKRSASRVSCYDAADRFWDDADFEMTVTDEKGLILFTMRVVGTEAPAIRR